MKKYLITASGKDRIGLVSDLSNIITHNNIIFGKLKPNIKPPILF